MAQNFWRFRFNSKGEGIYDKIWPIFRTRGDITDVEKGRDLVLSLSLTKSNKGREYTQISSIIPEDPSPLTTDKEKLEKWVNDTLVWSDVYSKKPEEYLDMVAQGENPKWDNNAKKWVSGAISESTIGGDNSSEPAPLIVDPQANEPPEEDDLPF